MNYKIMYVLLSLLMIVLPWVSSKAEEPLQVTAQAPAEQKKDDAKIQVDLDFKDVDIKEVARAFSRISGTSIIVSDDVKVKVTLHVQAIDWKEALGVILGAYNLTMMEKDKFIIITTFERRRQSEESGELKTRVVTEFCRCG
jgi:type II secretory pathway component HofQ